MCRNLPLRTKSEAPFFGGADRFSRGLRVESRPYLISLVASHLGPLAGPRFSVEMASPLLAVQVPRAYGLIDTLS